MRAGRARRRPAARPGAQPRHRRADLDRGAGVGGVAGDRPADRRGGGRAPGPRLGHRLLGRRPVAGGVPAGLAGLRRPGRGAGPYVGRARVTRVAVVVPVYRNAATLAELVARLGTALAGRDWRLRLGGDACPAGSAEVALALAGPRVAVTGLTV